MIAIGTFIGSRTALRRALFVLGGAAAVFVLLNVGLLVVYSGRTYPGANVAGHAIGGLRQAELTAQLTNLPLLPKTLELTYQDKSITIPPSDLGIRLDTAATTRQALSHRWLPIANVISPPEVPINVTVGDKLFDAKLAELISAYKKEPADARILVQNNTFVLSHAQPGHQPDAVESKRILISQIGKGRRTIMLAKHVLQPKVPDSALAASLKTLQAQQKVALSYTLNGTTATVTAGEVAGWYSESGSTLAVSDAKVRAHIIQTGRTLGLYIKNTSEATNATLAALQQQKPLTFALDATPVGKTYTYCVRANGVDASYLPALQAKLRATYADERGWGLGGSVAFTEVAAGCNYTVWLSAASLVPSYGSICDAMWSCMPGSTVVINFDRWQGASDAWNAAGGTLDDYRSMVINHESGHWLGFGHKSCTGAGQPAPVMQQQSIDLQGCVFNPWPTTGERAELKARLGL